MSDDVSGRLHEMLAARMARTERARQAKRCMQVKSDGLRCGSPAMRTSPFCYFHDQMVNRWPPSQFPPLEDANAIQMSLMLVLDQLAAGTIDRAMANTMIYGLQTASSNLRRVRFEPL